MGNILLVGEHPCGTTGNSQMMRGVLSQINLNQHKVTCFAVESSRIDFQYIIHNDLPIKLLNAGEENDIWGHNKLLEIVRTGEIHTLAMIGIDIWRYGAIMSRLQELCNARKIKWVFLFPYELKTVRQDWVKWMNMVHYPCVYSQYGLNMLKGHVENIRYFRPTFDFGEYAESYSEEKKRKIKKDLFRLNDDQFLFGFIGNNQFRKDPQKVLRAFSSVTKTMPDAYLYMHTNLNSGVFNLTQYALDHGLNNGRLLTKDNNAQYSIKHMVDLYNSFDCLVSTSMQEGLSWTVLESMACGCPILAPKNSAHTELLVEYPLAMQCTVPGNLPVVTSQGSSWVDTDCVSADIVSTYMRLVSNNSIIRDRMKQDGFKIYKKWVDNVDNFNLLLEEVRIKKPIIVSAPVKENALLFIQHSAAGDVLMTTRCLKPLKARHKGIPLHFMTMPKYAGLLVDNPNVDKIIEWDEELFKTARQRYEFVYNPHGDRILPGGWGRNCNSILSDFYWKILNVEPDNFFIAINEPEIHDHIKTVLRNNKVVVVHTTGGDAEFRTYKYMSDVCDGLEIAGYVTVQLGGRGDYDANAQYDFRGLSYQESAWVMNQAVGAVTVDSFMSHLAGALGVSQVCLFGCGNEMVVKPNQMAGILVCMSPDYVRDCKGLGPCSANERDCPIKCTGWHDPKDIVKSILEMDV